MTNVADSPAQVETPDESRTHLETLKARLAGKGYGAEIAGDVLVVHAMPADGGPRPVLMVTCRRRASDGNRWWFRSSEWVEEASHLVDAAVTIEGILTRGRA